MEISQRSSEWFAARRGRITASIVGAILGNNPYKSRDDVMRDKVRQSFGLEQEFQGNDATRFGEKYEDLTIQEYFFTTSKHIEESGLIIHKDYDYLACSPDGLLDENGGLEVKTPYRAKKAYSLAEKAYYRDQVMFSIIVADKQYWDFYCCVLQEKDGSLLNIDDHLETATREEAESWWSENFPKLEAFYQEFKAIIADEKLAKPYLEPKVKDVSDDKQFIILESSYAQAKSEFDKAEAKLKEVKDQMIEFAKEAGQSIEGNYNKVLKVTRKGSINYKKVPQLEGVNLEEYRGKSTEYFTIK